MPQKLAGLMNMVVNDATGGLSRVMMSCFRFAFWWLCSKRWMGGGPTHDSYCYVVFALHREREVIRRWINWGDDGNERL